jgi:molecular chaperone GrpE
LETVLTDNGIQTIEVKEGEEFDPSIHEAVSKEQSTENSQQEAETDEQSTVNKQQKAHVIAKVVQKGYKFGDRVIRPAKVIVK